MKNRLTTEQRDAIVSRLTDKRLYNLLNAICPSYEYKLKTVRPSTVEVILEKEYAEYVKAKDEARENR